MKCLRVNFRLPEVDTKRLRLLAKQMDMSRRKVVSTAIKELYERKQGERATTGHISNSNIGIERLTSGGGSGIE